MNNQKANKEKGVGKTLKKIGKVVLPVLGAIGTVGALGDAYGNYKYDSYMNALDGRGVIDNVKKGVKKHGKKIALGALGAYGAYKGLTYPFIPVGSGLEQHIGPVKGKRVKGKGVKDTLKKIGKVALPIAGTLGSAYLLDYLLNSGSYTPVDTSNYIENLGTHYDIKVPEWAREVQEQIGFGVGQRINLEKALPIKKDERINKFDYGKLAKYSAMAIPAGVLAYYAYKNNIVPNLYDKTRAFFKKDPTMIQMTDFEVEPENIPSLTEFSDEARRMIEVSDDDLLRRLNELRERADVGTSTADLLGDRFFGNLGTQTPISYVNEQAMNEIAKQMTQLRGFDPAPFTQIMDETNKLIKIVNKSSVKKDDLIAIAQELGLNTMEYTTGYTKADIIREIMPILDDRMAGAQEAIQSNVQRLGQLDERFYNVVEQAQKLAEEGKRIGKGIKKKTPKKAPKKANKKGKGKGLFLGMKNVEKYKNII